MSNIYSAFTEDLKHLVAMSGRNAPTIAKLGGLETGEVYRLIKGSRSRPEVQTIIRLVIGILGDQELLESEADLREAFTTLVLARAEDDAVATPRKQRS